MADVPVYESELRAPRGPEVTVQPINAPVADTSAIGAALGELGRAGGEFSARLAKGQAEAQDATIKTKYLEGIAGLRDTYVNSEKFQTAPADFVGARKKLEQDLLSGVPDPQKRAQLGFYFAVHGLEAERAVKNKALANEGDAYRAGTAERLGEYARKIASAGSDIERDTLIKQRDADIDSGVQTGWFSRVEGVQLKVSADHTQDETGARQLIAENPAAAVIGLMDPQQFKSLGPLKREELLRTAQAAQDNRARLEMQNRAQVDPAGAIAGVGRVADVDRASGPLFDRIVQIESAGRNLPPNEAGATGPAQIKISTARDVLKGQGRDDLMALDDTALAVKLNENGGALSKSLGFSYFKQMLGRYQGLGSQVAAAVVAYQAGPGAADKWIREAVAKAGPNFTPAELLEVITADPAANARETEKYLPNFLKAVGANPRGPMLTPEGQLHAAVAVDTAIRAQDADKNRIIDSVAQGNWIANNPVPLLTDGITPDPAQEAAFVQSQRAAALGGNMEAAKRLREYTFARELLPVVQQFMRTSPAQLQDFVTGMEAELRSRPATPDEFNRLTAAKRVLANVIEKRNSDPISLVEQSGFVSPDQRAVVDPNAAPDDPGFLRALGMRGTQAQISISRYDGSGSVLKPQEKAALADRYKNAGPEEQYQLLRAFGRALDGRPLSDTIAAVTGNEQAAPIVAEFVRDRPDLAREMLAGAKLLEQKDVQEKAKLIRQQLATKFGGLIYPSPAMQEAAVKAALYLDTSRRAKRGALYDENDTSGFQQALEDITGKIIKLNGVNTPLPRGMTLNQFDRMRDNLTSRELDLSGGAYDLNGRPLAVESQIYSTNPFKTPGLADYWVLKPTSIGGSHYFVGVRDPSMRDGFRPVFTFGETAGPLVVDLWALSARVSDRGLTPYQKGRRAAGGAAWERVRQDWLQAQQ